MSNVVEDPQVNARYYHLTGEGIEWTKEVVPNRVFVDVDANGRAVGIEILGEPMSVDVALAVVRAATFKRE